MQVISLVRWAVLQQELDDTSTTRVQRSLQTAPTFSSDCFCPKTARCTAGRQKCWGPDTPPGGGTGGRGASVCGARGGTRLTRVLSSWHRWCFLPHFITKREAAEVGELYTGDFVPAHLRFFSPVTVIFGEPLGQILAAS